MSEMLSVNTLAYSVPQSYQLSSLPQPAVSEPTDVVIEVHASSINPIDVKKAAGMLKMALKDEFPYKLGYDCAGVVTAVGEQVSRLKIGDEVYVRLPEASRGAWSEYAKCAERYVALKPKNLSFEDAASIPLAAMTAYQALSKYRGSLAGKTVFVPAGLGGTGSYACQLAKSAFNAGRVITTVSTAKIPRVPELLGEGIVDQIIDYTKNDPSEVIPPQSIDFMFDTTGDAMKFLSLMTPETSTIISISTTPSGTQLQQADVMQGPSRPQMPWILYIFLNTTDAVRKLRAKRWKVHYEYIFVATNAVDLDTLREIVEAGKLVPVIGSRVNFQKIENVREACRQVYEGRGGLGKTVISIK
ncbi:putative alcohol dehydrogenase [Polychaeton citri CBS 116435]|uniref:Alcohol dehydrogenase n=1 Tax=Polychaeton citri CBS 116435 TaxID=1314669 RepID=A0A9P4Q2A4_9PEZI|nr:putative alcohol dehydrogenase [Polychaeton citri CBS 116435]